jgi:hypothetical protein
VNENPNNSGHSLPYRLYDSQPIPAYQALKTIWDRKRLFLFASFSSATNHYVCEAGEDYHKLVKKYALLDNQFDIWFSDDGKIMLTPDIEFFVLEFAF